MKVYIVIHKWQEEGVFYEKETILSVCDSIEVAESLKDKIQQCLKSDVIIREYDTDNYSKFDSGEYRSFWAVYNDKSGHLQLSEETFSFVGYGSIDSNLDHTEVTMGLLAKDFGDAEKKFMEELKKYKEELKNEFI